MLVPSTSSAYYREDVLVEPGLVSHWSLNDTGSTAIDSKGVNPGTFYGTVTKAVPGLVTADKGNLAADFDGSRDASPFRTRRLLISPAR